MEDQCHYCGLASDTTDHVVPQSLLETLDILDDMETKRILVSRNRILTVNACRECNSLLSNKYFNTLAQRKQYLKRRLKQRYQKYLALPEWTDTELGTLSSKLRTYVLQGLRAKELVTERLLY